MTAGRSLPHRSTARASNAPPVTTMTVDAAHDAHDTHDAPAESSGWPASPVPTQVPVQAPTQVPPQASAVAVDAADAADPPADYPQPKLRLEVRDLAHEGADVFLGAVNAAAVLHKAVGHVQRLLYGRSTRHADPDTHMPPTRSVTVILRAMDGVAYTTGSELDSDHKEIHFSLAYIAGIRPRAARVPSEVAGVLTHELVHCYQWNGRGTCPGGLVEGIADWVRLRCALSPPHWKREPAAAGRWDAGYQHTAFFLDYLERRFGDGTVRRINERLRLARYDGASFWPALLGHDVDALWADYKEAVEGGHDG